MVTTLNNWALLGLVGKWRVGLWVPRIILSRQGSALLNDLSAVPCFSVADWCHVGDGAGTELCQHCPASLVAACTRVHPPELAQAGRGRVPVWLRHPAVSSPRPVLPEPLGNSGFATRGSWFTLAASGHGKSIMFVYVALRWYCCGSGSGEGAIWHPVSSTPSACTAGGQPQPSAYTSHWYPRTGSRRGVASGSKPWGIETEAWVQVAAPKGWRPHFQHHRKLVSRNWLCMSVLKPVVPGTL